MHDGTVHVVLINKGPRTRIYALRLPGSTRSATLERLQGASLQSPSGVTLGGQSYGAQTTSGRIGPVAHTTLKPIAGRYVVTLPSASAAMLTTG
jgi:hypothetical protein